jgi:hypothetical protein
MSEDSTHSGTGRWIALTTAVVTLVGAAVSAGLVHANANDQPSQIQGQNNIPPIATPTSTPKSQTTATPQLTPTPSPDTTWRPKAAGLCTTTQRSLDAHANELRAATEWEQMVFFGQAVKVMDSHLKQVVAAPEAQTRIQLMVQNWDTAAEALIRAGAAADRGDLAQAYTERMAYDDPNGRGNQIADDLGLTACADLTLPTPVR